MNTIRAYFYGLNSLSAQGRKTRAILKALPLDLVEVKKEELYQSVGAIAQLEGWEKDSSKIFTGDAPQSDFILFATSNADEIMPILSILKGANAQIDAKGVLTEHNVAWPFINFIADGSEEAIIMEDYKKIYALAKASEGVFELSSIQEKSQALFNSEVEVSLEESHRVWKDIKAIFENFTGRQEFTGPVSLTLTPELQAAPKASSEEIARYLESLQDKEIQVSALVEGDESDFRFIWNDKEEGARHKPIALEDLHSLFVNVSSYAQFGKLERIALHYTKAPQSIALQGSRLGWTLPLAAHNTPETLAQVISLLHENGSIKQIFVDKDCASYELESTEGLAAIFVAGYNALGEGDRALVTL
ncbi:MAG: hypothetical protein Q4E22_02700 [Coriobacteriia bacterium]|nr:hypothetical protein [Coriobacteriia bacterium]